MGKGACVQGQDIDSTWMDRQQSERGSGSEAQGRRVDQGMENFMGAMGAVTDFGLPSGVMEVVDFCAWLELCANITSPAAPAELGFKKANAGGRLFQRLHGHPGVR